MLPKRALIRPLVLLVAIAIAAVTAGAETAWNFSKIAAYYLLVLSFIVFIHEFGHYIIAKWAGVRIVTFSIGFGRELVGWNDRSGTRWQISLIPLGGYVKMFGDASEASDPSAELHSLSEEDKKYTFFHKALYKKAAIVAAGPIFNFLLAIVIVAGLSYTYGVSSQLPIAETIIKDSAADAAGLKPGDRIVSIDGKKMEVFQDILLTLSTNLGTPVDLRIERDGKQNNVTITPKIVASKDIFGNEGTQPMIGIGSGKMSIQKLSFPGSILYAIKGTYSFCTNTLKAVGQILVGQRSASKNIKGPISMANMVGQAAERGFPTMLSLMALLSANLGLVNLFPIPILDGGHLLIYLIQAVTRRPMNEKLQEYSFRVGLALISMLMAFAVINDFWPGIFNGK